MKNLPCFVVAAALFLAPALPSWSARVGEIDNSISWIFHTPHIEPVPYTIPFADSATFAIGQTFFKPAIFEYVLTLNSVGLWINTPVTPLDFNVYTAEWDSTNARVAGPLYLWEGPDRTATISIPGNAPGYINYRFDDTIGMPIADGIPYILFVTSLEFEPQVAQVARFGHVPDPSPFTGGDYWIFDGAGLDQVGETSWTKSEGDLAFSATFEGNPPVIRPIPEASTYGLFGVVVLVSAVAWRRQCFQRAPASAQPTARGLALIRLQHPKVRVTADEAVRRDL